MRGFLKNSTEVYSRRGIFLEHHFNNYIVRADRQLVEGYEVGFQYRSQNLKKIFGEFFERETLINMNVSRTKRKIAVNLLDGTSREIDESSVVLVDKFVDSCGMASHINSEAVIRAAYFEFFERQSFILNYLSETVAREIDIMDVDKLVRTQEYLYRYVDALRYFNISLSENIHVILCLGFGERKCIGLGTSCSLEEAVYKSQIEALQYFAIDFSKQKWEKNEDVMDYIKGIYHLEFDKMSVDDFLRAYNYLLQQVEEKEKVRQKECCISLWELIKVNEEAYNFGAEIVILKNHSEIKNLKVVKILSEKWFPHMYPRYFNENIYDFVQTITGKYIRKNIKYIPFP